MVCTEPCFEASHGKGAPDGVGCSLKRSADLLVRHARDITEAMSFYQELRDSYSQIQLHYISEEEVERKAQKMSEVSLVTVKGTMRTLKYRDVSCLC